MADRSKFYSKEAAGPAANTFCSEPRAGTCAVYKFCNTAPAAHTVRKLAIALLGETVLFVSVDRKLEKKRERRNHESAVRSLQEDGLPRREAQLSGQGEVAEPR